jgi:hypothetical protein
MNFRRLSVGIILVPFLMPVATANDSSGFGQSPLVQLVRQATRQFTDVQLAIAAGYEPGPCVSGPNEGAMGIHYVNPAFLDDAAPVLEEPEALIYEQRPNGRLRLVGVEYITLAGPAALEGHLFNYVGSPNRYGLPEFYELHVWAWKENPKGTFADWNPRVSCDAFAGA